MPNFSVNSLKKRFFQNIRKPLQMNQKLALVVAVADETFGIGYEGNLPWHIPGEMK